MSDTTTSTLPAGWYPDPAGERAWRVWNGRDWSHVTQSYGEEPIAPSKVRDAIVAHDALCRYGIVTYYGGLGLLIDAYHHRTSTVASSHWNSFSVLCTVALALTLLGHLAFTRACATLLDRPSATAWIPGLNVMQWARHAFLRANYQLPLSRRFRGTRAEAAEAGALNALFTFAALGAYALAPLPSILVISILLHLVPAVGAAIILRWARLLRDDLAG
jgi:hypothetical protein